MECQTLKCSFKLKEFFFGHIFLVSEINNQHVFPVGAQFFLIFESGLVHYYTSAIVTVKHIQIIGCLFLNEAIFPPRISNCGHFIYGKLSTEHAHAGPANNISVCLTSGV